MALPETPKAYNDFRRTFKVSEPADTSADALDAYIRDTYKDLNSFRKLSDTEKQNVVAKLL